RSRWRGSAWLRVLGRGVALVGLPGLEEALGLDGIVAAVAPRVAAQKPPPREHRAAQYAKAGDRLQRVARAGRLVLAAPRDRRRDDEPVEHDRCREEQT